MRCAHGSSPRGRGKPTCIRMMEAPLGLIPAWAGKTSSIPRPTRTRGAHPRVGGENYELTVDGMIIPGSSPRGRGKPPRRVAPPTPGGLIPAWAGKTSPFRSARPPSRAHPRVGGENVSCRLTLYLRTGSSPRGRGKRLHIEPGSAPGRLIPAWAGKTGAEEGLGVADRAHPRVGGENPGFGGEVSEMRGSSPRGRGKPGQ